MQAGSAAGASVARRSQPRGTRLRSMCRAARGACQRRALHSHGHTLRLRGPLPLRRAAEEVWPAAVPLVRHHSFDAARTPGSAGAASGRDATDPLHRIEYLARGTAVSNPHRHQEQRLALCGCDHRSTCVRHAAFFCIIAISLYRKIARPSKFSREDPKCSVKRATAQRAALTAPRPLRRGLVPLAHHLAHDLQVGRGGR